MNKEIEKKYVINAIPSELKFDYLKEIHQSYLAIGEEEIRVRKIINEGQVTHTFTIKKGSGLSREEFETDINQTTYEQLLNISVNKPLKKTRSTAKLQTASEDVTVEIDTYHDLKLIVAEIEFDDKETAINFVQPDWFGEDVTENKMYKNQSLRKSLNQ